MKRNNSTMESNIEPEQKKQNGKKWTWAEWALVAGVLLTLIFPALLSLPGRWIKFNEHTAWIGDTVGGITGPIVGLLGAYLVYRALKAQIRANEIITDQFKEQKDENAYQFRIQQIITRLTMLRENINGFTYESVDDINALKTAQKRISFRGSDGFVQILHMYPYRHNLSISERGLLANRLTQFSFILSELHILLEDIGEDELLTETDKNYLIELVYGTYQMNCYMPLFDAGDGRPDILNDSYHSIEQFMEDYNAIE